MRPIWKGSISFGLVYIPVAVYPATREEKLSFRQLRSSDLSPIRYKKVAEADSKEVPADQIVKGFEYERGRYVVMKDEDFEKVRIESTHSIDITDFVDLEPDKYRDEYRTALMEIIEQKAQHKEITTKAPALPSPTNVVDLVKVLQDSLNRTQSVRQKRSAGRPSGRGSTSALVKQRRRAGALG